MYGMYDTAARYHFIAFETLFAVSPQAPPDVPPTALNAVIHAIDIIASMIAYSSEVAPRSSPQNRTRRLPGERVVVVSRAFMRLGSLHHVDYNRSRSIARNGSSAGGMS